MNVRIIFKLLSNMKLYTSDKSLDFEYSIKTLRNIIVSISYFSEFDA